MADERPDQPQPPRWDPSRSHVPDLESFLQQLYVDQFVSVEPTSAQFSALSARVAVLSTLVGTGGAGSVTSAEHLSLVQQVSGLSVINANLFVSGNISTVSGMVTGKWPAGAAYAFWGHRILDHTLATQYALLQQDTGDTYLNAAGGGGLRLRIGNTGGWMLTSARHFEAETDDTLDIGAVTSGRPRDVYIARNLQVSGTISAPIIDTLSNAISVLSNQISALSQSHSALSNAVSVISNQVSALSQAVSVMSQFLSVRDAALSVRIDTQSQSISVLSNQISALSQVHSALSNAVSVLSNQVSVLSNQVSVLSQAVSVLSQAVSVLSAATGVKHPNTPGGRLTFQTGVPVMVSATASALSILYTPYLHNRVPIWIAGTTSAWSVFLINETSMSLDTSVHTTSSIYDIFAVNDGGTFRIGSGPAWTNDTTRALSLQQKEGIYTNMSIISALRYGSLAVSAVSANTATYLGTFRTIAAGVSRFTFGTLGATAAGETGNLLLWNMYNRVFVETLTRDGTDSWGYNTGAYRPFNAISSATSAMRTHVVIGLQEDYIEAFVLQVIAGGGANGSPSVAIGVDSDTVASGALVYGPGGTALTIPFYNTYATQLMGFHYFQALEYANPGGGNYTAYGDGATAFIQNGFGIRGWF